MAQRFVRLDVVALYARMYLVDSGEKFLPTILTAYLGKLAGRHNMHWSKIAIRRRRFLRFFGASAITLWSGRVFLQGVQALAMSETVEKDALMPTLYIPHGGGPCFFMEWTMGPRDTWDGMAAWLKQLASTLPQKPKAMLVISAHWEEPSVTINSGAAPGLLYDYYGFPPETYEIKYDAPGSPTVAYRVQELLTQAKIENRFEDARGLDHGVFVPLKLVYPQADIPVVQLSLRKGLDPAWHIALGRALAPLRSEGVLIIGSGMSYHNLRRFGGNGAEASSAFDQWLFQSLSQSDKEKRDQLLAAWEEAPSAREAHPREEHLLPLMVAAGAAGVDRAKRIYNEKVMGMAISGYQFG